MKEHFIQALRHLLAVICEQGELVENHIHRAIDAFSALDAAAAASIISDDVRIDSAELRIEEECLKVLALYQPVATDLRTVVAILKINTCLERMADFGAHIAERAVALAERRANPAEAMDFSAMEEAVLGMLRDSLEAMRHGNTRLAYKVIEQDDEVDQARRNTSQMARAAIRRNPEEVDYYLCCTGISRDLERIADLACDICEHLIYLETGKIVRHTN